MIPKNLKFVSVFYFTLVYASYQLNHVVKFREEDAYVQQMCWTIMAIGKK